MRVINVISINTCTGNLYAQFYDNAVPAVDVYEHMYICICAFASMFTLITSQVLVQMPLVPFNCRPLKDKLREV